MDAVGLAVGVVGLAGLFSTCLDIMDRFDSFKEFGPCMAPASPLGQYERRAVH